VSTVSYPVQGFIDGVGPGSYAANSAAGATGTVSPENAGFAGGGQIGFNWQFSPVWVGSFEADIDGIGNKGTGAINTIVGPFPFVGVGEIINTQISSKEVDYLGTVRGRVGYLWTPTFLLYGTGGLAYGGVKASTSIAQSNNDCASAPGVCIATNAATSGGISQTKTGWTAGGGFEWLIDPRWSFKAEYLYYDLGSVTYSNGPLVTTNLSCGVCGAGPAIVNSQSTTKFNGNIARVGLNYHF
jgi:outer membrane immunogenic protein